MITFAYKRQLLNGSIRYLIYNLGLVDILFSLLIFTRTTITAVKGAHGHGMPSTGHLVFRFIGFTFTAVQLTTQTAIACERFIAVKFPTAYRSMANASRKWILVSVWLGSAAVGLVVVIPSIVLGYPRAISIFCCGVYSLAMILTAGMYLFMLKELRDNRIKMRKTANSSTTDASKKRQALSRAQEQEILFLAVGIVSTYFFLNTPLNVYSAFYESSSRVASLVAQPCYTTNGVFANVAIGLASLNKFFDPILYFYMRYRMTKRRENKAKASEASRLANMTGPSARFKTETPGNVNGGYVGVKEQDGEGQDQAQKVITVQSKEAASFDTKNVGFIDTKEITAKDYTSVFHLGSSKTNQPEAKEQISTNVSRKLKA